jgi:polyphosphate kinase
MVFAHGDASRGGDGDAFYLLGSADLMPRNLDRRVEAMVPIDDPRLRARVDDILGVELNDAHLAWSLDADGKWRRVGNKPETNSQQLLVDMAKAGALR